MLISIDYDNTYSADPPALRDVTAAFKAAGHRVIFCTGRAFPPPRDLCPEPMYCTAGQAKRDYLAAQGLHPDVWIDDDPASILTDGV